MELSEERETERCLERKWKRQRHTNIEVDRANEWKKEEIKAEYFLNEININIVLFSVLNVAAGKAPMQSSVAEGGIPQKAVDGSTSTFYDASTW